MDPRLKAARQLKRLSQAEAARLANIDQPHYSRIEAGSRPSRPVADQIARALGQAPGVLWSNYETFRVLPSQRIKAQQLACLLMAQEDAI